MIIPLIVLRSTEFSASCGTKFKAPGNSTANVDIILDLVVLNLVLLVVLRHRYSSNGTRFSSAQISTSGVLRVPTVLILTIVPNLVLLVQLRLHGIDKQKQAFNAIILGFGGWCDWCDRRAFCYAFMSACKLLP